jgi:hypothetical protein
MRTGASLGDPRQPRLKSVGHRPTEGDGRAGKPGTEADVSAKSKQDQDDKAREKALDEALEDTFPASDPVSRENPSVAHPPDRTADKNRPKR